MGSHPDPRAATVAPARGGERGPYLRLQNTTIFVRDVERTRRFFVDQLGFTLTLDTLINGTRWIAIAPPDGTASLAVYAPSRNADFYELIGRAQQITFMTENVVAIYDEWKRRGVRFHHPPQTPVWGGTFTSFEDPDGNTFSLVGFDEVTRQIESERTQKEQKLEAERRAARDMEIAKQVQARLFPQQLPSLPTLDYAGLCIQARQVGGDYYDFLQFGPGRLGLVIGDIAGKGIAAALLMVNLQANLRSQSAIAADQPEQLLRSVNQLFYENTADSAYATLFFADYDDATGLLVYANCGHLPALLFHAGERDERIKRLQPSTTVLGLFRQWECTVERQQLTPGDTLVLYTDGVTEAVNAAGEEFGEERLIEAVLRHLHLDARALVAAVIAEVSRFSPGEQGDDITLIVARCRAAAA